MTIGRRQTLLVVLLLSAATGGCERGERAPTPGVSIDTLASGGVVVHNSGPGMWDEGGAWHVEEMLRIGELDGDGPTVIGGIRAIEVDAEGNILVFDHLANELRIFSAEGLHQRTIGRAGEGPGEFQSVLAVSQSPDGLTWVVDGRNARYTVIDPAGELSYVPRASSVSRSWVGGFDREGRFHEWAVEAEDQGLVDVMLRIDADGEVTERFRLPRIEVPAPEVAPGMSMSLPFAPSVIRAWDPDGGIWQALSSEYRITNVRLGGDTAMVIVRDVPPIPFSAAQEDSLASVIQGVESQFGVNVAAEMRPRAISPIRWIAVDDEDRVWVCSMGLEPCGELDVFDRSGRFLGTLQLPEPVADAPRPVIREGKIYASVEGELGSPQVWVGRIVVP